jgi:hypothetical protein
MTSGCSLAFPGASIFLALNSSPETAAFGAVADMAQARAGPNARLLVFQRGKWVGRAIKVERLG